jgi:hypothetical protein
MKTRTRTGLIWGGIVAVGIAGVAIFCAEERSMILPVIGIGIVGGGILTAMIVFTES